MLFSEVESRIKLRLAMGQGFFLVTENRCYSINQKNKLYIDRYNKS